MNGLSDAKRIKIDFLRAALRNEASGYTARVAVNRKWCRPLHPDGMRMVRMGLFVLKRDGSSGRTRTTFMLITPEGRAEYARLERLHKLPPLIKAP